MSFDKYFIYIDILGYKKYIEDLAKKHNIESGELSFKFIKTVKERLNEIS